MMVVVTIEKGTSNFIYSTQVDPYFIDTVVEDGGTILCIHQNNERAPDHYKKLYLFFKSALTTTMVYIMICLCRDHDLPVS
jgi:hypothetical protein